MSGTVLQGRSASPGLAAGVAFWIVEQNAATLRRSIVRRQVGPELYRFNRAYKSALAELRQLETKSSAELPGQLSEIFGAHRHMLEDPVIRARIGERIRKKMICSEWAVEEVYDEIAVVFEKMKNKHMAARRDDVRDVMRFLLDHLVNGSASGPSPGWHARKWADLPDRPFIAVADELSPAETASLIHSKVVGMVTRHGGSTSHAAIIAREMNIPQIFGIPEKFLRSILNGDRLLVDGSAGRVSVNPSPSIDARFKKRLLEFKNIQKINLRSALLPAMSLDGIEVHLRANIEMENEVGMAKKFGADGVGLFRTEYLYLDKPLPDEESLFKAYRKVARAVAPSPLVVRTMDLGGDKFLSPVNVAEDINPMLGMRAIRLCLAQPKLLIPQIRAALRANVSGNLRLCLPLVSAVEEIVQVRAYIDREIRTFERKKIPHRPLPVGIMVEVPSVAVRIERFLPHADFFSIGTNDLVQYTLAVSRTQESVAYLYRPLDPSILWLLSHVSRICRGAGKEVSLCGEGANNPLFVPFLLGIGLRDLSMAPPAIPDIKRLIGGLRIRQCEDIADRMLEFTMTDEVEGFIRAEVYPMLRQIIPQHYSYITMESELR